MSTPLALAVIGAQFVVRLGVTTGVERAEVDRMLALFVRGVEEATGAPIAVGLEPAGCQDPGCDVAELQIVGVPSRVRLVVRRRGADGVDRQEQLDLVRGAPGDAAVPDWGAPVIGLVSRLYADAAPGSDSRAPEGAAVLTTPGPEIEEGPKVLPWVLIASGVALAGVGVGVGLHNAQLRRMGERAPHSDERVEELQSQTFVTALVANTAFGLAVLAGAGGVFALVFD